MTKLWIMSDLHDDFSRASLGNLSLPHDVEADVLVIAGDIAGRLSRMGRAWLEAQDRKMPILVVPGNHDFWRGTLETEIQRLRDRLQVDFVHVLDGDSIELAGTRFVGGTLWTDYALWDDDAWRGQQAAQVGLNDFKHIRVEDYKRKVAPKDFLEIHRRHRQAIDGILSIPFNGPSVVVTHHAPSAMSLRHDRPTQALDAAYASNLEPLIIKHQPELWIHGHIHDAKDYAIGDTRVVCNPRGYRHAEYDRARKASMEAGLEVYEDTFDEHLVIDVHRRPRIDPWGCPMPYEDEVALWRQNEDMAVMTDEQLLDTSFVTGRKV